MERERSMVIERGEKKKDPEISNMQDNSWALEEKRRKHGACINRGRIGKRGRRRTEWMSDIIEWEGGLHHFAWDIMSISCI